MESVRYALGIDNNIYFNIYILPEVDVNDIFNDSKVSKNQYARGCYMYYRESSW